MEWALIWLVCPFAGGAIAARREATITGLLLGLMFGPLGVLLALLADNRKKYPHCKSRIAKGAPPSAQRVAVPSPGLRGSRKPWRLATTADSWASSRRLTTAPAARKISACGSESPHAVNRCT
jgi:hypothetical protein